MLVPHRVFLVAAALAFACAPVEQADLSTGDGEDTSASGNLTGLPPMTTATPGDTSDPTPSTTGGADDDDDDDDDSTDMGGEATATDTSDTSDTSDTTSSTEDSSETGTTTDTGPMLLPCADDNAGGSVPAMVTGNTERATDDFAPSCVEGNDNDVAVQFTAPAAGIYEMDTSGSDLDTILYVLDGCGGDELECVDDISAGNTASWLGVTLQEDQTVVVIVDGFNASGDYALEINLYDPDSAAGTEGFGDCINADAASACLEDEFCVGTMSGMEAVCAYRCNEVSDCPDLPPGGNASATCEDITANGLPECQIDCSGGQTCPDGMFCFGNNLCLWSEN